MKFFLNLLGLISVFAAGWFACLNFNGVGNVNNIARVNPLKSAADKEEIKPAYMIISVNEINPHKMEPFKAAVKPIVQSVGGADLIAISASENIEVLEGEFNYPGILLIERFESMTAIKDYWYSDEYQEVKKLREGHAEANFFIALEGADQ